MREGLLASFESPDALLRALARVRAAGYAKLETYTPYPVPELEDALALPRSTNPRFALAGGIFGALFGYAFQYYSRVVAYPLDVGGRPIHAWPTFIPITFEMTLLFAGAGSFFAWLYLSELPLLYRPVFEVERFRAATVDGFFLAIDAEDGRFDAVSTEALLRDAGASAVDSFGEAP